MTTKLEYLKKCVTHRTPLESYAWYVNAIAIPMISKKPVSEMLHLELSLQADGMYYLDNIDSPGTLTRIVDHVKGQPLFVVRDKVAVDSTWLSTIDKPMEINIGNLFINTVAIHPTVGNKIPFFSGHIKAKALENAIAAVMHDEGPDFDPSRHVTPAQYLDCMDRLWIFSKLANLVTMAASEKTVTPAPGTKALRDKLLQENKDKLSDPVVGASIIQTLAEHDDKYLGDDPVAKNMFDKKARTARKKLYLMYGETNDFITTLGSNPITSSLSDSVDTSDDVLPKYMNDMRYASYSRGHSTQLSGYSYKILQRSLSGIEISETDCNTTRGVRSKHAKTQNLVGRYVRLSSKWVLMTSDEQAAKLANQEIEVRSPMYCKSPGFTLCYKCLGESFKGSKNAMNNLAADFSGTLMGMFLKRMHTSGFTLTKIDSKDLVT